MRRILLIAAILVGCNKPWASDPVVVTPSPAPVAAPAKRDAAIAAFWTWFGTNAAKLRAEKDLMRVMETISAELVKIDEHVVGEIGDGKTERMLVLTVNGKTELFPLVQAIHAARPSKLAGWNVVAFRQRAALDELKSVEFGMQGGKFNASMITFVASRADDKLDVMLFSPSEDVSDPAKNMLMVMLDHAIGEYDTETRIGGIGFEPRSKAPKTAQPLTELPKLVDQLKTKP